LHPHLAAKALQDFWLNTLSRGYIQLVRERISEEDENAKYVIKKAYTDLIKLASPIIPFATDYIWQSLRQKNIVKEESVHLSEWPEFGKKLIDEKLETEMQSMFEIIVAGLAKRDEEKIGLKWPLAKAKITTKEKLNKEFEAIILTQLNVKKLEIKVDKNAKTISVELDTKLTPELEAEGFARELSRAIQSYRKQLGLQQKDLIDLELVLDSELQAKLNPQKDFIAKRINAKSLTIVSEAKDYKNKTNFKLKDKDIIIAIL
jgi:isoleucyl-tRNA synthetase